MVRRDYTKEVGLERRREKVSLRVAAPIIIALIICAALFVVGLARSRHDSEKPPIHRVTD